MSSTAPSADLPVVDVPALRAQVPALDEGLAFFDGPGGTQVPGPVAAAAAEATLLVVLAGRTAASSLREAQAALAAAGAKLEGVALNDRDHPTLAAELSRQAARLSRLAPGLHRRLDRAVLEQHCPVCHPLDLAEVMARNDHGAAVRAH